MKANLITDHLKRSIGRHHFRAVEAGDYVLSIQASEGHYCAPRETFEDPKDYTSFEVAIYRKGTRRVLNYRLSSKIRAFRGYKELGGDGQVIGWMRPALIHELYEYLKGEES